MLALTEAEIRAEAIPSHMHQGKNTTKHMIDRGKTPMIMVHLVQINGYTTLCLPIE